MCFHPLSRVVNPGRLVHIFKTIAVLLMAFVVPLSGQDDQSVIYQLDWKRQNWQAGSRYQVLHPSSEAEPAESKEILMSIEIETQAKGSFAAYNAQTPYIDGREFSNFGEGQNLGVIFDPEPGQSQVPVLIKLRFSQPVQFLDFIISDIDAAEGRIDSVMVWGNAKDVFPQLTVSSEDPTVVVRGRTAVARAGKSGSAKTGSAFGGENNGDVQVSFGPEYLDSITIAYFEVSKSHDPLARGIGLFAGLQFQPAEILPMNLLKFGVVLDANCQPIVRWSTNQEFELSEYVVEYSYDGYNFFPTASVKAKNHYSKECEYDVPLYRGLNTDNYFRLVKLNADGDQEILTSQSISGSECFHFTAVNVYPNPSSGNYVYVEIEATEQKPTDIAIIDQYGELLVQTRYELKRGQNRFKLESRHLTPGLYNLRFAIGQEVVTKQVSILP